jgi:Putative mono-oxygenase ydhR
MITAVVTFKLPPGTTREQWLERITQVAARFQNVPGLIRKQFLYSDEGLAGGVYLWETREAAEALYAGPWRDNLRNLTGADPDIAWFDTQIVVDNESREIKVAA